MSSSRDRALSILELLVSHSRGLAMSEIADRLDIPRAATHRVLADLKEMGYIKQDQRSNLYLLTVKLAALGVGYLGNRGITDCIQPILEELAEETGELARLAIFESQQLIWTSKAQGARSGLRYDPDAGTTVYLPASANGIALLSALTEEAALNLVAAQGLDRLKGMGPNAPKSLRDVIDMIDSARKLGYAAVFESYEAGTSAVACPIITQDSFRPVGSVSIAGPSVRMTKEKVESLVPVLIRYRDQLSQLNSRTKILGDG